MSPRKPAITEERLIAALDVAQAFVDDARRTCRANDTPRNRVRVVAALEFELEALRALFAFRDSVEPKPKPAPGAKRRGRPRRDLLSDYDRDAES